MPNGEADCSPRFDCPCKDDEHNDRLTDTMTLYVKEACI